MTRELAGKSGRRLEDVEDWRPLLEFTQGNPLTFTVLVGQALRDGLRSRAQIANFVRKLSAGERVSKMRPARDGHGRLRHRSLTVSRVLLPKPSGSNSRCCTSSRASWTSMHCA